MPRLTGLFIHPVKSLRGCAVVEMAVDELGPVGDRRFLVVDESGKFITQRTLPRMARIATGLTADQLELSAEGAGLIRIARPSDPAAPLRPVTIWKDEGLLAEDCGDVPAAWLSDALATRCRLVRVGEKFHRPIPERKLPAEWRVATPPMADCTTSTVALNSHPSTLNPSVSCADAYPFLILSEASLAVLNDRLQENHADPVPLDRFRANLVVADCAPFAEDTWPRFRIGPVGFRAGGPCARCIMTTTDQLTGQRSGPEPLHTLAQFRRDAVKPSEVNFGQNLIHETKSGVLRLGDEVVLP